MKNNLKDINYEKNKTRVNKEILQQEAKKSSIGKTISSLIPVIATKIPVKMQMIIFIASFFFLSFVIIGIVTTIGWIIALPTAVHLTLGVILLSIIGIIYLKKLLKKLDAAIKLRLLVQGLTIRLSKAKNLFKNINLKK